MVNGKTIYLAYLRKLPDGDHVYLTYSLDNGLTWNRERDVSGPIDDKISGNPDEVFQPGISTWNGIFSIVYVSQGNVIVRSTHDISHHLSVPYVLGPGSNAMIGGGNVLWLGPGAGQGQPVFYARCH